MLSHSFLAQRIQPARSSRQIPIGMLCDFAAVDWNRRHMDNSDQEWLMPFSELRSVLSKQLAGLPSCTPLLELGCGTSDLAARLFDDGWRNVTSVDLSRAAVQQAHARFSGGRPGLMFALSDARRLDGFGSSEFGCVIDKGTLDAICCGEGFDYEGRLVLKSVERVLVPGGRWVCVSLMGPAVVMPMLDQAAWPYRHHERLGSSGLHLYQARRHRRGHIRTRWFWHPVEGGWATRSAGALV